MDKNCIYVRNRLSDKNRVVIDTKYNCEDFKILTTETIEEQNKEKDILECFEMVEIKKI